MLNLSYISRQKELRRSKLIEKAESQIGYIVSVLKDLLKPSKIIVFGSINDRGKFDWYSDIDVAISDIDENKYLYAYGEILARSSFPVDLIILEKASKVLKEKILKTGRVVYGEKGWLEDKDVNIRDKG